MTPQNSSHQKDDMKKNPFGGPKYIRPHGTKFRRPGDLAHGIYGSLSKKKFFSEIHRFKEKRGGGYSALPIYFTEHSSGWNTREISPVFECRGLTSQLWTFWARVSHMLAITGNVLHYCSKFPAINFHSLSDKTTEPAMSMIDYEGNKNRPSLQQTNVPAWLHFCNRSSLKLDITVRKTLLCPPHSSSTL